jgi:hypothetical protein
MAVLTRRLLLASGFSLAAQAGPPTPKNAVVRRFATAECDIQMTVEFHDRYSTRGLWFDAADRHFCLSPRGEEARDCMGSFTGSLAIARYQIQMRSRARGVATLREHVSTIDQDSSLDYRPPLERTIELRQGVASDLQAFGYETAASVPVATPEDGGPWYYFRQELYFEWRNTPFLIVHWRQAFNGIRILDVIPGKGTWPVQNQ